MSWNYRVVRRQLGGEDEFAIHEAYCDEQGKVWGITEEPPYPAGETLAELAEDVAAYCAALALSVLEHGGPFDGVKPGDDEGETFA